MSKNNKLQRSSSRTKEVLNGQPLNAATIKSHAGQFDMDAVSVLHYTGRELPRISCLEECVNAIEVNFSDNSLSKIEGLNMLTRLKKLVLTNNKIKYVEGLERLDGLEHLLLQGNQILSLGDLNLPLLQTLPKLVSLYLKNVDGSQPNPVCKESAYRGTILSHLPNLRNLDGERLRVSAQQAFDNVTQETRQMVMGGGGETWEVDGGGEVSSFVPPGFWNLDYNVEINLIAKRKELRRELGVCSELNKKAKDLIKAADLSIKA